MKTCKSCNRSLALGAFWKRKGNKDGRYGRCKECMKQGDTQFVEDKIEFVEKFAAKFYPFLPRKDVSAIADCAEFLLPGPRIEKNEFRRIISRRFYYMAIDYGWIKRSSKWQRIEAPNYACDVSERF